MTRVDSWLLTQAISPRRRVRAASVDAYGQVLNTYAATIAVSDDAPTVPWAVHLTDSAGAYRLLALDFDAGANPVAAATDAQTFFDVLTQAGIEALLCESGPAGGRHIWLATADPLPAEFVYDLAMLVKQAHPTLDVAPLTNARTGAVRPPGAPHRSGGQSKLLAGSPSILLHPTTSLAQLQDVATSLAATREFVPARRPSDKNAAITLDRDGHPYLPGPRRQLPARSAAALAHFAPNDDASAVLWSVLIGAAAARWHFQDLVDHLETAPGLEYARTRRLPDNTRTPRPKTGSSSPLAVLRYQWIRAVQHVATTPRQIGEDPTFEPRAAAIADAIDALQTRADATTGRWQTRSGPSDRRVLDALCLLALQAVSPTIEADIRRLALMTGIGRETARTALIRLANDGWITKAQAADGPNGTHWKIAPPPAIHRDDTSTRSQAVTRPAGAGTAKRDLLKDQLTHRLDQASHDAFTPRGLGLHAGNIYARLTATATTSQLAQQTAQTLETAQETLNKLSAYNLIQRTAYGWQPTQIDNRGHVATQLATAGTLAERAKRYEIERAVWAWWLTEQMWMKSAGRRNRRQVSQQVALSLGKPWDIYPAYPRSHTNRANHRAALEAARAGDLMTLAA